MLTHVLLDLDGTLVDSAPGILGSLRRAIDEVGLDVPEDALGTHLLGRRSTGRCRRSSARPALRR
ncbi:hypothetical protein [Jannaschia sp. R86511]|uniref:hypothetical protein n=1 Tax=Jannaschia sp. R86511 TaxID=3093853 RepID=UPI0036D43FAD